MPQPLISLFLLLTSDSACILFLAHSDFDLHLERILCVCVCVCILCSMCVYIYECVHIFIHIYVYMNKFLAWVFSMKNIYLLYQKTFVATYFPAIFISLDGSSQTRLTCKNSHLFWYFCHFLSSTISYTWTEPHVVLGIRKKKKQLRHWGSNGFRKGFTWHWGK